MIAIVAATIGGIYLGVFTPSEAAAVGAFLALCWAVLAAHAGLKMSSSSCCSRPSRPPPSCS
jgi:TRAP-type C4-dicarboxylate transport system permease large subunit